ncbi:MAG: ATPase, T2SS/T4P/T4SS family [Thermogutta sp.]
MPFPVWGTHRSTFFPEKTRFQHPDDLGFPHQMVEVLRWALSETSGAILVTGPRDSGKTTTMYACLRELAEETIPRNLMTIEDPIEVAIPRVIQSQADPRVGLDLATAIRYLMRQDPEVVAVGEIRDRITAEVAIEASLTWHPYS